jgi:hypothetical protein
VKMDRKVRGQKARDLSGGTNTMSKSYEGGCEGSNCCYCCGWGERSGSRERDDVDGPPLSSDAE